MSAPTLGLTGQQPRSSAWLRVLGLGLAGLLLCVLIAAQVYHLVGRSQYQKSVRHFVGELGDVVADPSPGALQSQLAGIVSAPLGDADNAAHWLLAGAELMAWEEGELRSLREELGPRPAQTWTPEMKDLARRMVERNADALRIVRRSVPLMRSSYGVDYGALLDAEVPDSLQLLNTARLLNVEARWSLIEGEPERAYGALQALSRLTQSLRQESLLIFTLMAHGTEKQLLQGIAEAMESSPEWAVQPEVLQRLQSLLASDDLVMASRRVVALEAAVTSLARLEGRTDSTWNLRENALQTYLEGYRGASRALDQGREAIELAARPFSEVEQPPRQWRGNARRVDLRRLYFSSMFRAKLALSQRRLVQAALALQQQGWKVGDPACPSLAILSSPDPLTGDPLACRIDQAGLHLAIAEESEVQEVIDFLRSRQFMWLLELRLPPTDSLG